MLIENRVTFPNQKKPGSSWKSNPACSERKALVYRLRLRRCPQLNFILNYAVMTQRTRHFDFVYNTNSPSNLTCLQSFRSLPLRLINQQFCRNLRKILAFLSKVKKFSLGDFFFPDGEFSLFCCIWTSENCIKRWTSTSTRISNVWRRKMAPRVRSEEHFLNRIFATLGPMI